MLVLFCDTVGDQKFSNRKFRRSVTILLTSWRGYAFHICIPFGGEIYRWPVVSPHKEPVKRTYDVFFVDSLRKPLSKYSSYRWFLTHLRFPWRHRDHPESMLRTLLLKLLTQVLTLLAIEQKHCGQIMDELIHAMVYIPVIHVTVVRWYISGLMQDCSISSAFALEILQSCTKPSIWQWPRPPTT